ncbi:cytochrome P450 [Calothrix sp. NIES-4071]|nr:cytochrome P450 [Calothrix sp. NIES-4071]BAZ60040.1 cytochrome P450 [Calothrix sp. NIES-4105]
MLKTDIKLPNQSKAPAFIQAMQWIIAPMSMMESYAKRYGDIFTLCVSPKRTPIVFISNPIALQEILTGDSTKQFSAPGETNVIFATLLGEYSLMSLGGVQHQRQRQLLTPPFHGERMLGYTKIINNLTEEVMNGLEIGRPFSVRDITQAITLRTIMKAVFGLDEGSRARGLEMFVNAITNQLTSVAGVTMLYFPGLRKDWGALSPWGKYLRRRQETDKLLYQEIRERREKADLSKTDILSLLLSATDEAGQPMSDKELRDELLTLLVAGQETTATALAWALYWIHKLPEVKEKLLKEIDSNGACDITTLTKLPYLNAVCCETLRIHPVAMLTLPRVVEKPVKLCGWDLEPGTLLYGSIYLTHQREDLYPEPKKFKPERFLARQFTPYEFLPFGGGVRRCIGAAFALFEMKVALVKILSEYSLTLVDNGEVKPKRRGLVTAPASTINMVVTGRRVSLNTNSVSEASTVK